MKYDLPDYVEEKIESSIDKRSSSECWNWGMRVNQVGRPITSYEYKENGKRVVKTVLVQHYVLEKFLGREIPNRYTDLFCGNLLCCNPRHIISRNIETRLWSNVIKTNDGCWEWQGAVGSKNGYGVITIGKGKTTSVHRLAHELVNGEIPDGLSVLHRCNNRICINPEHLYVGTHNDNMRDMADSNNLKGENNPKAILTESQVVEIKSAIKSRMITYQNLADKYGVTRQAIKDIALGRTWAWLE